MSIKSIKEKQLLVNLAKSFGQQADPLIIKELEEHKKFEDNIKGSIRNNILTDLNNALLELKEQADEISIKNNFPLPPSLEELENLITEETDVLVQKQAEKISEPSRKDIAEENSNTSAGEQTRTITDLVSHAISKSVKKESFDQPDPLLVDADIGAIQRKIKFLEQWLGKISAHGPGGGAGSVARLDHETKLINVPTYNITSKDFYLGVNYNGNVSITLPSVTNNGRMYIIKDESGNCSINPITVFGNVDNDPGGFILQQDNGGIQMIYRNGWRIV